jgi:glycerol transport system substrate-binding protein
MRCCRCPAASAAHRRQAAWLSAHFCVCKSVSLKKTLVGLMPIRASDIDSAAMTEAAPRLGGLVEFYRSPARMAWTPTGLNVPDYAKLAQLWWTRIGDAVTGKRSPQQTLDALAEAQDQVLARIAAAGLLKRCAPALNQAEDPQTWLQRPGAPKPKLPDEEGRGRTMDYEAMLEAWRQGHASI